MTKIGDVIQPRESIPDDVTGVTDNDGDFWEPGEDGWDLGGAADGGYTGKTSEWLARTFAPLTVTAVREPERDDSSVSGLCEVGPDRVTCIVADPNHRRIYHGGSPLGDVATTLLAAAQPERDVEDDVHYYVSELRPGTTFCGIGLDEDNDLSTTDEPGKATCDTCRAEADEDAVGASDTDGFLRLKGAAPVTSTLLDLVQQYGDARERFISCVGCDTLDESRAHEQAAQVLLDRIAALVPQQPEAPDFLASVNRLTIARDAMERHRDELHVELVKTRGEREDARAEVDRLTSSIESQIAAKESWIGATEKIKDVVTRPLCLLLNVYHNEDIVPAVETLKDALDVAKLVTPPADSSVLTLPQVPPGTVALIGAESGKRYVQSFAGGSWTDEETAQVMPLWRVLERECSVTVVMREPRTWPRLDTISNDLKAVQGASGKVYHRSHFSQSVPVFRERGNDGDPLTGPGHMFYALQTFDGPLTEVFEDEPGGEPR